MSTLRRFNSDIKKFVSIWDTNKTSAGSSAANQIRLPLLNPSSTGIYDFKINWGDGSESHITAYDQAEILHTYAASGIYTLTITGKFRGFRFNNSGDRLKISEILSFGPLELIDQAWFYGCSNLNLANVSDVPRNYAVASNWYAFMNCTNLTTIKNFTSWLIASHDATNFFRGSKFNQPLAGLKTGHISIWHSMFRDNLFFNQDISMLDFSSVTDMTNFMTGKSPANYNASYYDSLLITLDATGKTNVPLGMGAIKYTSAGSAARANLIAKGWIITDGGII